MASFVKPNQIAGPDDIIPPHVLKNAKGLAIITVLKAGFLFSGRAGSGVIVARLPDGSWSAPSAIVTAGAGVGGQIGAELTDFVSAILERREANRKFYGNNCKAAQILAGRVEVPPACDSLMRVLESRAFSNRTPYEDDDFYNDDYYDDIPDDFSSTTSGSPPRSRNNSYARGNSRRYDSDYSDSDDDYGTSRTSGRGSTNRMSRKASASRSGWEDDVYDNRDVDRLGSRLGGTRISSGGPARPADTSKPNFGGSAKANSTQAIALFTFKGEQSGDLAFKKGDVIDILKKSDTTDDWWTGRNNGVTGIFPANYVELI